jgi:hypothetical protein
MINITRYDQYPTEMVQLISKTVRSEIHELINLSGMRKDCLHSGMNELHAYLQLHTPSSRVLLEKLTGFQLVKKFPALYGTGRFITAFTSARHLFLS